jgi:outer membrane protein assembly factor BamB
VDGEGHGRPVSDAGTAYFLSTRHEVVAIAAATGAMRWRQSTSEPGASTAGSAVVLAGSVVVAGDYNLVAFDRVTGAFRWRFVPAIGFAPGIYLGESSGGLVLAGSPAGRLYAVSAATGELVWTTVIASDGLTTVFQPATDGTVAAAGYTTFVAPNVGGVVLAELGTGRELWRTAFPRPADHLLGTGSTGGPVLTDTAVIASSGDGTVYGFNRTNGSILWTLPPIQVLPPILQGPVPFPSASAGADYRPLARTGPTLFVGSLKGHVVAYDLATRLQRWKYVDDLSGSVSFALVSDSRSVYVPFVSGRHIALNVLTGGERWRTTDARDDFLWPAAPTSDRVYIAGGRGGFVALRTGR